MLSFFSVLLVYATHLKHQNAPKIFRNQEKGVLAKGVSVESSVTAKATESTQGCWPQQYIWHSERHSQERRTFCKNPLLKPPLFLVPKGSRLAEGCFFPQGCSQHFAPPIPMTPAELKTLRDSSELLRWSVFTTAPIFATMWTFFWEERCL